MKAQFSKKDARYALESFLTVWRRQGGETVSMSALVPVFKETGDAVVVSSTLGEVLDRLLAR